MEMKADNLDLRYDAVCKQVLSEKGILAYILKYCVEEYADLERSEIEKYITGKPKLGEVLVEPNATRIESEQTEDKSLAEGVVTYDIRFTATAPSNGEEIELIINIEAQNKYNPGYPLLKRAEYYCSRMMSSQYGSVFTKSHYEKIKKVYSIWICTDVPQDRAGTITKYEIHEVNVYGNAHEPRADYDLRTVIMICLGENKDGLDYRSSLLDMLNYLMLNRLDTYKQKHKVLNDEFNVQMTPGLEKGMSDMCNLSQGIREAGRAEGRAEMYELTQEIREAGKAEGVLGVALNLLNMKLHLSDIVRATNLSPEAVRKLAQDNGLSVI